MENQQENPKIVGNNEKWKITWSLPNEEKYNKVLTDAYVKYIEKTTDEKEFQYIKHTYDNLLINFDTIKICIQQMPYLTYPTIDIMLLGYVNSREINEYFLTPISCNYKGRKPFEKYTKEELLNIGYSILEEFDVNFGKMINLIVEKLCLPNQTIVFDDLLNK